jgi:hypothetical protein
MKSAIKSLVIFFVTASSRFNNNLLFLVSSSFLMFAYLLLLNFKGKHLSSLRLLLCHTWLLAPTLLRRRGLWGNRICKGICMLLRLLHHQIIILIFVCFFRTFLICFRHFLSHNLWEDTISTRWIEEPLGLDLCLSFFLSSLLLQKVQIRLLDLTFLVRLPVGRV